MDKAKANQLLAAAIKGDATKIQQLLGAGAPIEATDVNRATPIMLAAQGGHAEAFHVLADAGANLHALAFRQLDLLEMAARGGNVAIVRFLLDQGLPVDGHWQPSAPALQKLGHDTPLIQAATDGHVEVVRVLLAAGADRERMYEGKTALARVKECLRDPLFSKAKSQYLEIAALLGDVSAQPAEDPAPLEEVARFAANARQPAYGQWRQQLTERCGEGRVWQPVPDHGIAAADVVAFTLRQCKKKKTLTDLQAEVRSASFHLVLTQPWAPGENAELVLLPTRDKFAVVAAIGTEGSNYGVQTADVLAWLRALDADNPFVLAYCGHDLVGGAFLGPVKAGKQLAERMAALCPSVLDEGFETPAELARALSKGRTFLLRWD